MTDQLPCGCKTVAMKWESLLQIEDQTHSPQGITFAPSLVRVKVLALGSSWLSVLLLGE